MRSVLLRKGLHCKPARSSKGDTCSASSFHWDQFAFWDLFGSGLSHPRTYGGLWIWLSVCWEDCGVKTIKEKCFWGVRGRKTPTVFPPGLWGYPNISIQIVPTSIFFCKKLECHIYPGFIHGLNLGLVGWAVALLFLEMEAHISFAGSEPKLMGL